MEFNPRQVESNHVMQYHSFTNTCRLSFGLKQYREQITKHKQLYCRQRLKAISMRYRKKNYKNLKTGTLSSDFNGKKSAVVLKR